jgi:hypothetical protein
VQQANDITVACQSLLSSTKLKQTLEVVLAYGNYMNSQRRGAAHGFRLNVLDRVCGISIKKILYFFFFL